MAGGVIDAMTVAGRLQLYYPKTPINECKQSKPRTVQNTICSALALQNPRRVSNWTWSMAGNNPNSIYFCRAI